MANREPVPESEHQHFSEDYLNKLKLNLKVNESTVVEDVQPVVVDKVEPESGVKVDTEKDDLEREKLVIDESDVGTITLDDLFGEQ